MPDYVQYGCGTSAPSSWLNFDASPRLRAERWPIIGHALRASGSIHFPPNVLFGDIVKGLPVPEQSVTGLFSSHVLEHIDRQTMPVALANSFKLLAPGGRFRLIMPDLVPLARHFLTQVDQGQAWASDTFMRYCCLGSEYPMRGVGGIARTLFGNSQHRWMYDPAQVRLMLEQAGFAEIRKCQFGDSEDLRFAEVEARDRYGAQGLEALAFEARRLD